MTFSASTVQSRYCPLLASPARSASMETWTVSGPVSRAAKLSTMGTPARPHRKSPTRCRSSALHNAVDGALLVEAWPVLALPEVIRAAWQPLIDGAKGTRSAKDLPLDPGGDVGCVGGGDEPNNVKIVKPVAFNTPNNASASRKCALPTAMMIFFVLMFARC